MHDVPSKWYPTLHLLHYVAPFPEHSRQDLQFKAEFDRHVAEFYEFVAKHSKHAIPSHSRTKNI